jgi:adenosylcobinamide-GDP ribazoletransferase
MSQSTSAPAGPLADLRASLGFFTRLPAGRATGPALDPGRIVLLAPLSGLLLAGLAGALLIMVDAGIDVAEGRLLAAVAATAAIAYLTRGLHLDGLADLADGLGASRDPVRARAVMHQSDIGPFGVIAILVVMLLQVAALAILAAAGASALALLVALPAGRLGIAWLCRPSWRAAPGSTLGGWVAGQVSPTSAALATGMGGLLAAAGGWAVAGAAAGASAAGAVLAAAIIALLVGRAASDRVGGVTGDVLGAAVEIAQTAALVLLALALG